MSKKKPLGRGLDALINFGEIETTSSSSIGEVDLETIIVNPDQPRQLFDEESLNELAESIRQIGVIQPITLRQLEDDNYQIVAGERRFRASQIAGMNKIPAYILKIENEKEGLEMALVENIQREDLRAIEIALAYQNLIENFSLTQEQLSKRVGKKRATISNYLRLLKLPAEIQMGLNEKRIDMGHARTLLSLTFPEDQLKLYNFILERGLSVRQVETIIQEVAGGTSLDSLISDKKDHRKSSGSKNGKSDFSSLGKHLSSFFGTKVLFACNDEGKGKITITFNNEEELTKIIAQLDNINKDDVK